jgi:hypothetical protein
MRNRTRISWLAAAITLGLLTGTLTAREAKADPPLFCWGNHGCWFNPPNPPSCAICADNCNPGQCCCFIL